MATRGQRVQPADLSAVGADMAREILARREDPQAHRLLYHRAVADRQWLHAWFHFERMQPSWMEWLREIARLGWHTPGEAICRLWQAVTVWWGRWWHWVLAVIGMAIIGVPAWKHRRTLGRWAKMLMEWGRQRLWWFRLRGIDPPPLRSGPTAKVAMSPEDLSRWADDLAPSNVGETLRQACRAEIGIFLLRDLYLLATANGPDGIARLEGVFAVGRLTGATIEALGERLFLRGNPPLEERVIIVGLQMTYDPALPPGARVTDVELASPRAWLWEVHYSCVCSTALLETLPSRSRQETFIPLEQEKLLAAFGRPSVSPEPA